MENNKIYYRIYQQPPSDKSPNKIILQSESNSNSGLPYKFLNFEEKFSNQNLKHKVEYRNITPSKTNNRNSTQNLQNNNVRYTVGNGNVNEALTTRYSVNNQTNNYLTNQNPNLQYTGINFNKNENKNQFKNFYKNTNNDISPSKSNPIQLKVFNRTPKLNYTSQKEGLVINNTNNINPNRYSYKDEDNKNQKNFNYEYGRTTFDDFNKNQTEKKEKDPHRNLTSKNTLPVVDINESFLYLKESTEKIEIAKKELEVKFNKLMKSKEKNDFMIKLFEERKILDDKNKKLQQDFFKLNQRLKEKDKSKKSNQVVDLNKEVEVLLLKMEGYRNQISNLKNRFNRIFTTEESILKKMSKKNINLQNKNKKEKSKLDQQNFKKKKEQAIDNFVKEFDNEFSKKFNFGIESVDFPKEIKKIEKARHENSDFKKLSNNKFEESLENFLQNNKDKFKNKITKQYWTMDETFSNVSSNHASTNISELLNNISKNSEDKNFIFDSKKYRQDPSSIASSIYKPKYIDSLSLNSKNLSIYK